MEMVPMEREPKGIDVCDNASVLAELNAPKQPALTVTSLGRWVWWGGMRGRFIRGFRGWRREKGGGWLNL